MFKKMLCLICSFCLALACLPAVPAWAGAEYSGGEGSPGAYGIGEFSDGDSCKLAVGAELVVPDDYDLSFSDTKVASYDAASHAIRGLAAGETTVSYKLRGEDGSDDGDDGWEDGDESWDSAEQGSFSLTVVSLADVQGKSYRVAMPERSDDWWDDYYAELKLPIKGVDADDEDAVCLIGPPTGAHLEGIGNGYLRLEFTRAKTYKLKLGIFGGTANISVEVVKVKLNESQLVLYKGKGTALKLSGAKDAKFSSDNELVATVGKSGKVKAKQLGSCTITVSAYDIALSCTVSVTSKKAYRAVCNARADLKKKYRYNQNKRMSKNYRDCSSFVSRCYWDSGLKRKILAIGGSTGKTWALTAADQAKWLNEKGRRVSYKAVPETALLPGDTIYYETNYAGRNKRYRNIDHAAIYVGGGLCLNTGGYGGKGTVGYRGYYPGNTSVKFIGRPVTSFVLDRCSLDLKPGKSSKLKALFAKGGVSFKSSKPSVATVSKNGKVTAKSAGTCTVTAKCKAGTYRCKVTVN